VDVAVVEAAVMLVVMIQKQCRHKQAAASQKHILLRCSTCKRERWATDDANAMQPASPKELSALREG
jgi:ABC-type xylose transport system substrate-binding protein